MYRKLVVILIILFIQSSCHDGTQIEISPKSNSTSLQSPTSQINLNAEPFVLTWNNVTKSVAPSSRSLQMMATDSYMNISLLFGGYDGVSALGDTWIFLHKNSTWLQLSPPDSPTARYGAILEYDPISAEFILAGGMDGSGAILDEVWSFDFGSYTWTLKANAMPLALYRPASASNLNGLIYVQGGNTGASNSKITFSYTVSTDTWTDLTKNTVKGLYGHSMICSPEGNMLYIFGGNDGATIISNGYSLDLTSGNWNALPGTPTFRWGHQMVFDHKENKGILFGGSNGTKYLNDLWLVEVTLPSYNIQFTPIYPNTNPEGRNAASLVYNINTQVYSLFGGEGVNDQLSDTWSIRAFESYSKPVLDSPSDISYEEGVSNYNVTWNAGFSYQVYDPLNPVSDKFVISRNESIVDSGNWDESTPLVYNVGGLSFGIWKFEITVNNSIGISNYDIVYVTVFDTTAPVINNPQDISFVEGTTGINLQWIATDLNPANYQIFENNSQVYNATWTSGVSINFTLDSLTFGIYNLTINVYDKSGNSNSDSVIVKVALNSSTSISEGSNTPTTSTRPSSTSKPPLPKSSQPAPGFGFFIILVPISLVAIRRKLK